MITVGIIGFGSFGLFLAEQLDAYCKVLGYSRSGKAGKWSANLEQVASADYVILSIPLDAYYETLRQIKPLLKPKSVIVDICSVKEKPIEIIREVLPQQPFVATHPLFGPESASTDLRDHVLVMCSEVSDKSAHQTIKAFAQNRELTVVEMSAQQHDQEMATVHALTFFIAHALKDMKLHNQKLSTPSFQKLLSLAELEKHHSDELFATIQQGNKYAPKIRESFIEEIKKLDATISRK